MEIGHLYKWAGYKQMYKEYYILNVNIFRKACGDVKQDMQVPNWVFLFFGFVPSQKCYLYVDFKIFSV